MSLAQLTDLIVPCLDAAGARVVVEVGAFAGDLTRFLVDWAERSGARVGAIDPSPQEPLVQLDRDHPELELIRKTSLEALPDIAMPDAVVIDGDHNFYTVARELELIAERTGDGMLPLLFFHDVCWPHGRRDDYFDAEQIPVDFRHPVAGMTGGLFPGEPGLRRDGLPYPRSAAQEGGARDGVLTAVEEFVAAREHLQLAVVPAFFGLGVAWDVRAPWADAVARILAPWDDSGLVSRLEQNRVHHIALGHQRRVETWRAEQRAARQEAVLRRMLDSSAFALAERLSRLRLRAGIAPADAAVSKDEIRRALAN